MASGEVGWSPSWIEKTSSRRSRSCGDHGSSSHSCGVDAASARHDCSTSSHPANPRSRSRPTKGPPPSSSPGSRTGSWPTARMPRCGRNRLATGTRLSPPSSGSLATRSATGIRCCSFSTSSRGSWYRRRGYPPSSRLRSRIYGAKTCRSSSCSPGAKSRCMSATSCMGPSSGGGPGGSNSHLSDTATPACSSRPGHPLIGCERGRCLAASPTTSSNGTRVDRLNGTSRTDSCGRVRSCTRRPS